MTKNSEIVLSSPPQQLSANFNPNQDAIGLTFYPKYIKWYSPSLDYPCILSPYYLFFPLKIYLKPYPRLEIAAEEGENEFLLASIKSQLLEAILKIPRDY